jgi:hypothetical protein
MHPEEVDGSFHNRCSSTAGSHWHLSTTQHHGAGYTFFQQQVRRSIFFPFSFVCDATVSRFYLLILQCAGARSGATPPSGVHWQSRRHNSMG